MSSSASRIQARIITGKPARRSGLAKWLDDALRRLIDLTAVFFGLLILAPAFAIIAILIRRDSEGPVFYWGPRMGKDGQPFRILKFRTMYERRESYQGPKVTGRGDPRITPVGHWLRNTKLNELPQLWNVLLGQMSLVGPRPEDPDIVTKWSETTRATLLSVRPGITSPASVLYRDEETLLETGDVMRDYLREILPDKLRLDSIYVRQRTILSDLDVIFWTMLALLPLLRRNPITEHALYWGPLSRILIQHFSWFLVDLMASLLAVIVAGLVWRSSAPLHLGPSTALAVSFLIALVFTTVNAVLGLHRIYWSKAPASTTVLLAFSTGLATLVLMLVNLFWRPTPLLPTGMIVFTGVLAYADFVLLRYRERLLTGLATRWLKFRDPSRSAGERVLIVGAGEVATIAIWLLRREEFSRAFRIVGMVDDSPRMQGLELDRICVLDHTANIPRLVRELDIGLVLFAIADIAEKDREEILALCRQTPARVVLMPDILRTVRRSLLPDMEERVRRPVQTTATADLSTAQQPALPGGSDFSQWVVHLDKLIEQGSWDQAQAEIKQVCKDLPAARAMQGDLIETRREEAHG